MAYVYKITNTIDGKAYVGKTKHTIAQRFIRHLYKSLSTDTYLYRAMRLHGSENFQVEQVEEVDAGMLNERERFWIQTLDTMAPNGYNLTMGGDGGDVSMSPNYQRAMQNRDCRGQKNSMYGRRGQENPNYGSVRTDEQKINLKEGLQRAWDQNTDRKQQQSVRMSGESNPMFGKRPTNTKTVVLDGVLYDSIADCKKATKRSSFFILRHGIFNNGDAT